MPTTMRTIPSRVEHSAGDLVRLLDALRQEAAQLVADLLPHSRKKLRRIPGLNPTGLSRAKNGDVSNALYRAAVYVLACRALGVPELKARRIPGFLEAVIDQVYGAAPACVTTALIAEAAEDAAEDAAQAPALANPTPEALRHWLEHALQQRAALDAAIAAARRELAARARAA